MAQMADWILCNVCFRPPSANRKFYTTNCGHLYCDGCIDAGSPVCKQCKARCTLVNLGGKMKPEMEAFFTEPTALIKKHTKEYLQVLEFQRNHQQRCNAHLKQKIKQMSQQMGKMQAFVQQCQEQLKAAEKCKAENVYLKKLLERAAQQNSPRTARSSPGGSMMYSDQVYRNTSSTGSSPRGQPSNSPRGAPSPMGRSSSDFRVKPPYDMPSVTTGRVLMRTSPNLQSSSCTSSPSSSLGSMPAMSMPITPRHLVTPQQPTYSHASSSSRPSYMLQINRGFSNRH